jgi:hypothetical protein
MAGVATAICPIDSLRHGSGHDGLWLRAVSMVVRVADFSSTLMATFVAEAVLFIGLMRMMRTWLVKE